MYKLENRIGLRQFNVIKEHFFKVINRHFFKGVCGLFFNVIRGLFFNVIRGLFFNVIRGLRPANLDCRISSGNDSKVECVTSGNDGHWGRLLSDCKLFNYPSPADKSATSPARGEVLKHLFRVIRGHRPANLDPRVKPVDDSKVECVTSGNDNRVKSVKSGNVCRLGRWLRAVCNLINTPHSALSCHSLPHGAKDYGRSMIEMLGVLAIIGVLSVGGIAGYSKAMEKWKINKTIEQIEEITQNILTLYANQKTLDFGLEEDVYMVKVDNLKTLGIIPANLKQAERDYLFINPLGGTSSIYSGYDNLFEISVLYISKEACVALSTHNWNFSSPYFLGIAAVNEANTSPSSDYCIDDVDSQEGRYGEDGYFLACKCARTSTPRFGLPVPPEVAAEACSCKSNVCEFNITYSLTGVEDPENCGKDRD